MGTRTFFEPISLSTDMNTMLTTDTNTTPAAQRMLVRQSASRNLFAPLSEVERAAFPWGTATQTSKPATAAKPHWTERPLRPTTRHPFSLKKATPHNKRLAATRKLDHAVLKASVFSVKIDQPKLHRAILRCSLDSDSDDPSADHWYGSGSTFWHYALSCPDSDNESESSTNLLPPPPPSIAASPAEPNTISPEGIPTFKGLMRFHLSGYEGFEASKINGQYDQDGVDSASRPLFRHVQHENLWVFIDCGGHWRLGHTVDKEQGLAGGCGYARACVGGDTMPWHVNQWEGNQDGSRWCACPLHVSKLEEVHFVRSASVIRDSAMTEFV